MKPIYLITYFFCFILFTACGAKKIVVKNADHLIQKQVETRLPLYEEQESQLSKDIDQFLNDQKPKAKELVQVLDQWEAGSVKSWDQTYPKLNSIYLQVARDFSKILAKQIAQFDKKQARDFHKRTAKESSVIEKKGKVEYRKRIEKRITQILGSMTLTQKNILKENSEVFEKQVLRRVHRRNILQGELDKILIQDLSVKSKNDMIYEAFISYQKEALETSENPEIIKKFANTLTPKQEAHFKKHLGDLKEILEYFMLTKY